MRLKILSLFIIVQMASFALYQGLNPAVAEEPEVHGHEHQEVVHTAATPNNTNLRFSARSANQPRRAVNPVDRQQILEVIRKLPEQHYATLNNLVLDYDPEAHRGYGGRSKIILRAVDMTQEETAGVLIHEIGHTVDLGFLSPNNQTAKSEFTDGLNPVYETDPSLDFYRLSWKGNEQLKNGISNEDFVSGYAMSDPFEDFAETYIFYLFHNKTFRSMTHASDVLTQKYNFMRDVVFSGKEFNTGKITNEIKKRPWDITVMNFDLADFIANTES